MDLGKMLVELRHERGILQKELAEYLGVSIGTVSNYEHGVHNPDPETLKKLSDFFEVSTDYLLERTRYRYSPECLNKPVTMEYTAGDIMNISLELNIRNREALADYLKLLILRNEKMKNEQTGAKSGRTEQNGTQASETIAFIVTEKGAGSSDDGRVIEKDASGS